MAEGKNRRRVEVADWSQRVWKTGEQLAGLSELRATAEEPIVTVASDASSYSVNSSIASFYNLLSGWVQGQVSDRVMDRNAAALSEQFPAWRPRFFDSDSEPDVPLDEFKIAESLEDDLDDVLDARAEGRQAVKFAEAVRRSIGDLHDSSRLDPGERLAVLRSRRFPVANPRGDAPPGVKLDK